ncbi:HlyD family efflux transporter periplasmic adaptor subunit [Asaia siamensis]
MSSDLFRQEVLDSRRQSWLGRVQVIQPLSFRLVALATLALCLAAVCYVAFGVYTRRVHATGYMAPPSGLITVAVNATGVIAVQNAMEGQHVHKGDVLYVIDIESTSSSGPTQERVLAQLRQQSVILRKQKDLRIKDGPIEKTSIATQIRFLTQQHEEIRRQLDNDNNVLPMVESAMKRMQAAKTEHIVTETQFQNQLYTYAQLLSSHAQFLQNFSGIEGQIAELTTKLIRYDSQQMRDLNDLDKEIAQVDQQIIESESQRSNVVTAPEDGILTAIRSNRGQHVQSGQTLATLLPAGHTLEAKLFVNSASIGFLHEGEPVLLRYDAYPYQRFGLYRGTVLEVTRAPITVTDTNTTQGISPPAQPGRQGGDNGQSLYRIRIMPEKSYVTAYSRQRPLQAGMAVQADIAIDTRRLYQWLFDPLISVRDDIYMVSGGMVRGQ